MPRCLTWQFGDVARALASSGSVYSYCIPLFDDFFFDDPISSGCNLSFYSTRASHSRRFNKKLSRAVKFNKSTGHKTNKTTIRKKKKKSSQPKSLLSEEFIAWYEPINFDTKLSGYEYIQILYYISVIRVFECFI